LSDHKNDVKMKLIIGIDFSKTKFDATIIVAEGINEKAPRVHNVFANNIEGFRDFDKWVDANSGDVDKDEWIFGGENTGEYCKALAYYLYGTGRNIWIEDAYRMKHTMGMVREKSDKADSNRIAEVIMRNHDKAVWYKPEQQGIQDLREVFLWRQTLVCERRRLTVRTGEKQNVEKDVRDVKKALGGRTRAKMCSGSDFVRKLAQKQVRELDKQIKACDAEIKRIIDADEVLSGTKRIVTSIKGIGLQNAAALIVFTNNFARFDLNARKIASYYGIAPFKNESGSSVHCGTHVNSMANKMLKALLSEATLCAIKYCPEIRTYYDRMIMNKKKKQVALNNAKNKLLHIVVAMVRNNTTYNPAYLDSLTKKYDKNVA